MRSDFEIDVPIMVAGTDQLPVVGEEKMLSMISALLKGGG
jgi:hypothetical protein